jgi:hypothetical protein
MTQNSVPAAGKNCDKAFKITAAIYNINNGNAMKSGSAEMIKNSVPD